MSSLSAVPDIDVAPGSDYAPRLTTFVASSLERRSFLKVVGIGGVTLGMTVLGWLPTGRRAAATVGTEYTNCSKFLYSDSQFCDPAVYSASYCGTDKWFKNGCFHVSDGFYDCYRPIVACNSRNAWRWDHTPSGRIYRCADGEVKFSGTSTYAFRICSAVLGVSPHADDRT